MDQEEDLCKKARREMDSRNKPSEGGDGSQSDSLADYKRHIGEIDDDSDEEGQEFDNGGSEHSGEVIVGPGEKNFGDDVAKEIYEKHGGEMLEEEAGPSSRQKDTKYFSGGGYKLTETSDKHKSIPAAEDLSTRGQRKNKPAGARGHSRVHSLADYRKKTVDSDDESDEDGQEFYAGGSEHSGEVIVGPGKKKSGDNIVKEMFRNHGAIRVEEAGSSSKQRGTEYFSGGGYRLGETSDDHQYIPAQEDLPAGRPRQFDVYVKLDSEALIRLAKGGRDHKHEEYKPPNKKMTSFTGEGRMLGSTAPTINSQEPPSKPVTTSTPESLVTLNSNSPGTTIRIQMGDGSRVTQRFNHDHTVAEVYSFVRDCNPGDSRHFVLMTTHPNKELSEDSMKLKEGNLLNAVIIQRFK